LLAKQGICPNNKKEIASPTLAKFRMLFL